MILDGMGDEVSREQKKLTETHTHAQTQAMTMPEGQYWPRVKTLWDHYELCNLHKFKDRIRSHTCRWLQAIAFILNEILQKSFRLGIHHSNHPIKNIIEDIETTV